VQSSSRLGKPRAREVPLPKEKVEKDCKDGEHCEFKEVNWDKLLQHVKGGSKITYGLQNRQVILRHARFLGTGDPTADEPRVYKFLQASLVTCGSCQLWTQCKDHSKQKSNHKKAKKR
jgi:hypothetical protein